MATNLSLECLERGRAGQFFYSKKNRVFRSVVEGIPYVVKAYRGEWQERAAVEYGILVSCRQKEVPVPEPIALLEGAIVMAPVDGQVAGDVFDRLIVTRSAVGLTSEQERLADHLARWLARFHNAFDFGLTRGDSILRNFIVTDKGVVGLDFEESSPGDSLQDIGQICASALATDPPFTEKKVEFARRLADRYWACSGQRRADELGGAIAAAIRHYSQYRSNGPELLTYASRVEKGLIII